MKSLREAAKAVMVRPTPAALVELQGALLASSGQGRRVGRALEITGLFHSYLCELGSKMTARDFSELASRLDIGAVGAVAVENAIAAEQSHFWQKFLMGALAESLMVAASRQYVKAWEAEAGVVHGCAAWNLTGFLWEMSAEAQPELATERRWEAIHALLAPAHDPEVPAAAKALLLGRLFQTLSLVALAPLLMGEG